MCICWLDMVAWRCTALRPLSAHNPDRIKQCLSFPHLLHQLPLGEIFSKHISFLNCWTFKKIFNFSPTFFNFCSTWVMSKREFHIVMSGQFRTLDVLIPPESVTKYTQYLVLGMSSISYPFYVCICWLDIGWDSDGLACLICAGLAEGQSGPTYIHHSGHNTYNTIQYNCNTILAILTTLTYTTQQSSENIEDVQISHDIHERLKISFENHSFLAVVLID